MHDQCTIESAMQELWDWFGITAYLQLFTIYYVRSEHNCDIVNSRGGYNSMAMAALVQPRLCRLECSIKA